jgi:hypothetical protein
VRRGLLLSFRSVVRLRKKDGLKAALLMVLSLQCCFLGLIDDSVHWRAAVRFEHLTLLGQRCEPGSSRHEQTRPSTIFNCNSFILYSLQLQLDFNRVEFNLGAGCSDSNPMEGEHSNHKC